MKEQSKQSHVYLLGLAGGKGTRLWPLSHKGHEKQFCPLTEENTFIQATVRRFYKTGVKPNHVCAVTTTDSQTKLAASQLAPLRVVEPNVFQIPSTCGYPGAMIEGAKLIYEMDPEAIIINTPCDQFIDENENFESFIDSVNVAIEYAAADKPTIVGVKVQDLVMFMGCGHAEYDPNDSGICKKVKGFVEKPNAKTAKQMMRKDESVCNTGINVWKAKTLLDAVKGIEYDDENFGTADLMELLGDLYVTIGEFRWQDCGTLKSLWEVSKKTPNHRNASLGGGYIDRTDCLGSLFYSVEDIDLYATGIEDAAVVVNPIGEYVYVACVAHDECQMVRELAEHYEANEKILRNDYSIKARNNIILPSNFSKYLRVSFVGLDDLQVNSLRQPDGHIIISVSKKRDSAVAA